MPPIARWCGSRTARTSAADAVASAKPDVDHWFDQHRQEHRERAPADRRRPHRAARWPAERARRHRSDRSDDRADRTTWSSAVDEGRGDDGKGQLGRLINDSELGETLDDVSDAGVSAARSPRPVQVVARRARRVERVLRRAARSMSPPSSAATPTSSTSSSCRRAGRAAIPEDQLTDVSNAQQYNRYQEIDEGLRFTLEFGKRFGPLQLRAGIKESTFGAGSDLLFGRGRLAVLRRRVRRLLATRRASSSPVRCKVFRALYISGGVDDVLDKPGYLDIETGNAAVPTLLQQAALRPRLLPRRRAALHRRRSRHRWCGSTARCWRRC